MTSSKTPLLCQDLVRGRALIGGDWVEAVDGRTLDVIDPASGDVVGTVPAMGRVETQRAIAAASDAYEGWRSRLAHERGAILRRWAELVLEHTETLALLMTLEQGKPLDEARGEIQYAASFLDWFGEEARRAYGDTIPSHLPGSRVLVSREPIGVTAAITPWNFPSAMITRKAGAALAAGCTMIVRPASETPLSALALGRLAEEAGVPKGVLSIITGEAIPIAQVLCGSKTVRKLSFTGSTEVGRSLLASSAATVKKVSLELGGHAPFIVFDDADLDAAVAGACAAKFATSGQDCLAANRLFVHATLYERFVERFATATLSLRVGPGIESGVDIGPLMSLSAVETCEAHVADAVAHGARTVVGGGRHTLGRTFYEPTVLADVTEEMRIFHEETFGPVAPLLRFDTEEEVIYRSNDSIFGLAAYIYTQDIGRAFRVSDALEYGMVGINTSRFTGASIPFGGQKQSGIGREGSRYGLDDYTELKYVCFGGIDDD